MCAYASLLKPSKKSVTNCPPSSLASQAGSVWRKVRSRCNHINVEAGPTPITTYGQGLLCFGVGRRFLGPVMMMLMTMMIVVIVMVTTKKRKAANRQGRKVTTACRCDAAATVSKKNECRKKRAKQEIHMKPTNEQIQARGNAAR